MTTTTYPAFRDNTTFWEGKRIGVAQANSSVLYGTVESVSMSWRCGEKTARAVLVLEGSEARVIVWPDHLDAVFPLFAP